MKSFLVSISVVLLLPNLFVDSVVYISFLIDRDYIINNECVQKDEVVNTCEGSCVLENALKEVNKSQETADYPVSKETKVYSDYITSTNHFAGLFHTPELDVSLERTSFFIRESYSDIFHPPQV